MNLKTSFYLAGMDCGSGKSTLNKQFLKIWGGDFGLKPEGSFLIALPNLEQVERFANECGLQKANCAAYSANERIKSWAWQGQGVGSACPIHNTADDFKQDEPCRVIRGSCGFPLHGKPRPCRIWDESVNVARAIVITMDHLSSLPSKLRHKHADAVAILDGLQAAMIVVGEGGEVIVPTTVKTAFDRIIATGEHHGLSNEEQEAICDLKALAGLTVDIEKGVKGQLAIVGAGRPLPADFLPVIVFEASARVRQTYALHEKHFGNVIRLPCAIHDYQRATFHLWKEPMGTNKLADPKHRATVLSAIADLINADPESDWLIVHHKAKPGR